ncbi:MAG: AAA family ATPase [Sandaracinaceae bacterium]|nr:AAA family ATPase [Sandaracinaceae bacterium]
MDELRERMVRVRRRLVLRALIRSSVVVTIALGAAALVAALVLPSWPRWPWAVGLVLGPILGAWRARRIRPSDADVVLYIDRALGAEEAIVTAYEVGPDPPPLLRSTVSVARARLREADPRAALPALGWSQAAWLGPAVVFAALAQLVPVPARSASSHRVTLERPEALARIERLAEEELDPARRRHVEEAARRARELTRELASGVEREDAREALEAIRRELEAARRPESATERRARDAAVEALAVEPEMARALAERDPRALDAAVERAAARREAADRRRAREALEAAAAAAREAGDEALASSLLRRERLLSRRAEQARLARELAEAMPELAGTRLGRQLERLDRDGATSELSRELVQAMREAWSRLTPEERQRLADAMARAQTAENTEAQAQREEDAQPLDADEIERRLREALENLDRLQLGLGEGGMPLPARAAQAARATARRAGQAARGRAAARAPRAARPIACARATAPRAREARARPGRAVADDVRVGRSGGDAAPRRSRRGRGRRRDRRGRARRHRARADPRGLSRPRPYVLRSRREPRERGRGMTDDARVSAFSEVVGSLRAAVAEVVVGQREVVDDVLVCLFAGGHVLLEGAPGLGKTLLVRTLARALSLRFSRIQFTPDLMPGDIVGTNVVVEDERGRKRFELAKGPIFGQLVLADEINRATPKTQSALLEAMAERSVTIAGTVHRLEDPFFVLATENPIEMEGTYPLPEAQLDRFLFKVLVPAPDEDTLVAILERTTGAQEDEVPVVIDGPRLLELRALVREVHVPEPLTRWVARLVRASDPAQPGAARCARARLRYGAGVRGRSVHGARREGARAHGGARARLVRGSARRGAPPRSAIGSSRASRRRPTESAPTPSSTSSCRRSPRCPSAWRRSRDDGALARVSRRVRGARAGLARRGAGPARARPDARRAALRRRHADRRGLPRRAGHRGERLGPRSRRRGRAARARLRRPLRAARGPGGSAARRDASGRRDGVRRRARVARRRALRGGRAAARSRRGRPELRGGLSQRARAGRSSAAARRADRPRRHRPHAHGAPRGARAGGRRALRSGER